MAIKTTWTCDKCGHSQDTGAQMWGIRLHVNHMTYDDGPSSSKHDALWCRDCTEGAHLLPPYDKDETKHIPPVPPTLEDLIREIVRSELP